MGHHNGQSPNNHRELLPIRRRTESFLLVFSVAAIAFVLLTASVQTREATCQSRANIGIYSVYIRPDRENVSILSIISAALEKNGVRMVAYEREGPTESRIDVFDTPEMTLKNESFLLMRQTRGTSGGGAVHWQLRYLDRSLCTTNRKISMEALPNVDYERVKYTVRAIAANGKNAFLYISSVMTKDRNKITTFQQLQTLFPGFHGMVASPHMVTKRSIKLVRGHDALLYYGSSPLDIEILIEQRQQTDENVGSWRVSVSSRNPLLEVNLKHVASMIRRAAQENGLLCDNVSCGRMFHDVFLQ